jgi:peroxiredoxin
MPWPALSLRSTEGRVVSVADLESEWQALYFYPRTGLL